MIYENEFSLLRDVFKKCHLRISVFCPSDPAIGLFFADDILTDPLGAEKKTVWEYLNAPLGETMYIHRDRYKRSYIHFLLTYNENTRVVYIGPYLSSPLTDKELLYMGEKNSISPKNQKYLKEYYSSIPVLPDDDRLLIMLHSFLERVFGSSSFAIVNMEEAERQSVSDIHISAEGLNDAVLNIKAMETRYKYENELMEAVSLGQLHREASLIYALSEKNFDKRSSDSLRNCKNYSIIMNTLLRKAAERGGVHPVDLDAMSSGFAVRIEQLTAISDGISLMREMFRSYCRLVRKSSIGAYSQTVQRTMTIIDADLSGDLSTGALAKVQGISSGYLSSVFCKETGITLSEYVRKKRIGRAKELLRSTKLQVQTVALHCGIMDLQYFSKLFKRETGVPPKQYRASALKKIN